MNHGGAGTAYSNYGCRCAECRESNRIRTKRRRHERFAEAKEPNDPRHGKPSFYTNHGCRCAKCTEVHAAACKDYQKKVKERA